MTTIPPTTAPNLPAVVAAAAGPVVVVPQPPPELLKLPLGTTIETVVVAAEPQSSDNDDARQTLILRTSAGDVAVRTAVPLDEGARVALEVLRNAGNQITARVVTIDDVPAKQAVAQAARETASPAPDTAVVDKLSQAATAQRQTTLAVGQAWTPAGPAPLTSVQPLSAYVLNAPSLPQNAPATSLNNFLPGSDLGIRVVSVQTAPTLPSAAPSIFAVKPVAVATTGPQVQTHAQLTLQPAAPGLGVAPVGVASVGAPQKSPAAPTALSTAPNPAAASTAPKIAGVVTAPGQSAIPHQLSVTKGLQSPTTGSVVAIPQPETQGLKLSNAPGLGANPPTPPQKVESIPALAKITGQVSSISANGAAVVQTPVGDVQLNVRANLPLGSTVTFEVIAAAPPRADGQINPPAPPLPNLPLSNPNIGWGTLSEAVQLLQRTDPISATQLVAAIPDGGVRTAVATMAFMQAMRTGDARQWPGDSALRGLERAGPRGAQLASQISGEVREMAARASDVQGEWRTTPMPWNLEGKIERVNLVTRREDTGEEDGESNNKKGGKGKGTRFLVNLELSRLGELQLDGMFVKSTRAFDMMVRTKDALPEDIRRDLSGLFANSNAAMGLKGALSFQVVRKFADPANNKTFLQDRGGVWA